jgi:tRNA U34 5-methylaminomethyl-2-thiouridine-forming methyltransferase MnmC
MLKIINTEDGSHTVQSEHFDATYHSTKGSVQETKTVFIESGFKYLIDKGLKKIHILEIGFGTGLNVFMTYLEAKNHEVSIHFDSYELYPIGKENAKKLNYPQILDAENDTELFLAMHEAENLTFSTLLSNENHIDFQLKICSFESENFFPFYNLIYFDAFAPSVQPQLWQEPFLQKMYDALLPGGILVTYCAQGAFKRALKAVGFQVEALPGPKGKREMTRATKF